MLLATGHVDDAQRRRASADPPQTVRQHAVAHNLAVHLGEAPPKVSSWLKDLGTVLDPPIGYGGRLKLHGYQSHSIHRHGELIEAVFEVVRAPGSDWRPFFNRFSRPLDEDGPEAKMPMKARVLGAEATWKKGRLLVVRIYSELNPWRGSVRYELGFWRPTPRTKATHKAGPTPRQHLKVGKANAARIEHFDWRGRTSVPLPLRWIPYLAP